jgi:iron complex outermembrane recepter protein
MFVSFQAALLSIGGGSMKFLNYSVAVSLMVCGLASPAFAQVGAEGKSQAEAAGGGVGDIIVTARRSTERLQDVPVSITAFSSEFLERQNFIDAAALPQFAPNLTVAESPSSVSAAAVFIRGIGNNEVSSVSEQGVGLYLDGVYLARSSGAVFDLLDMERVEVLRGPQGTLFGRNTIGGAVQFITKKPTNDPHITLRGGYGSYNDWNVGARIDTGYLGGSPIKASLSVGHREADGYVNSTLRPSSKDPGALTSDSAAIGLEADLGKLTINYNFDYNKKNGVPAYFQILRTTPDAGTYFGNSPLFGGTSFLSGTKRLDDVRSEGLIDNKGRYRYPEAESEVSGHALTLAYDVSDALIIKSISGYREFFQDSILGLSGNAGLMGVVLDPVTFAPSVAPVTLYNGNNAPQKQQQISQELQALGKVGDFSYLAGLYYFHERASEDNHQSLTFVLPGGAAGINLSPVQAFSGTSESKAAFGQVSWKPASLDERLELTAGVRYTEDEKTTTLKGDVVPNLYGKVSGSNTSWLGSASYKLTSDIMAYARISTGYRSGGVNPRTSVINVFDPEKATAYEAGIKSDFFDKRLRVNLAAYLTDYTNLQVTQFAAGGGGATSLIVNAGEVQLSGFEAEFIAAPTKEITLDASVGYVSHDYKEFLFRDPLTNAILDVADQAKLTYTPEWSLHFGAEYAKPLSFATLRMRADLSYRSSFYFNALSITAPFNEDIQSKADRNLKLRASLEGIAVGGGQLDVGVWGDNVTDDENMVYGIDFGALGFAGGLFKKPATAGIDVKWHY